MVSFNLPNILLPTYSYRCPDTLPLQPFTQTLERDEGLLNKINNIFIAELVTSNAFRLSDPWGHVKRHFLAPRSKTQDAMNNHMSGSQIELAERVTDTTKVLFLAFWYTTIYPFGLFFCSFILLVNYFTDRFGLMVSMSKGKQHTLTM